MNTRDTESVRAKLSRWTLAWTFRLAETQVIHGLRVSVLWPRKEERPVMFLKIAEGLDLLERYDPRRLKRLQNDVSAILAQRTSGARAEWLPAAHLVRLQSSYIKAPDTSPLAIASTLVHEGAHARLHGAGIDYDEPRRAQVEAVCFRAQLSFLHRVPDCTDLAAGIERQLARDPAYWTDRAFLDRQVAHLANLGVPNWIVRVLVRMRPRMSGRGHR